MLREFFPCKCQLCIKFVKNLESYQALYKSFYHFYTSLTISFQEFIEKVEPYTKKKNTLMRKATNVDERLSLTLRFVATGHSFSNLEACNAIYDCLKEKYLKIPQTKEDWNVLLTRLKKDGSFLTGSEQRTGNIHPLYTLKILGQIFTIIKVSSACNASNCQI